MSTPFTIGHGTGNDFVLLDDHDGALDGAGGRALWGPRLAAALAHRRTGIGADGVVRVVRSAALPEGRALLETSPGATWFMDHRNADGTTAEMCGNGVRVLAAHLVAAGLVSAQEMAQGIVVGTRAGARTVVSTTGPDGAPWWRAGMGPARLVDPGAVDAGGDALVAVAGLEVERPALSVDVGNPHTVVVLADGVIRVVRSAALPEGRAVLETAPGATWFMDHRNADGTTAEMCGNGVRVLAAHLVAAGLVGADEMAAGIVVGTRAGARTVVATTGPDGSPWWRVGMGPARAVDPGAVGAGGDAVVAVAGLDVERPALSVDVGNPHTVVVLADEAELDAADLTRAPRTDPEPPRGSNVELVVPVDREIAPGAGPGGGPETHEVGRLRMRVHERGVGETLSCGTGVCAAAVAARAWAGGSAGGAPSSWLVEVPGGLLAVDLAPDATVVLSGPAVLVASGTVDLGAFAAPDGAA